MAAGRVPLPVLASLPGAAEAVVSARVGRLLAALHGEVGVVPVAAVRLAGPAETGARVAAALPVHVAAALDVVVLFAVQDVAAGVHVLDVVAHLGPDARAVAGQVMRRWTSLRAPARRARRL